MAFQVRAEQNDHQAVVSVEGELDLATKVEFVDCVQRLVDAGASHVRADLSGLLFCDSTGLSALIRAKRICDGAGGSFRVCRATAGVSALFRITGLDAAFGNPAD
jgi:anti-sigma B factor antagonist